MSVQSRDSAVCTEAGLDCGTLYVQVTLEAVMHTFNPIGRRAGYTTGVSGTRTKEKQVLNIYRLTVFLANNPDRRIRAGFGTQPNGLV